MRAAKTPIERDATQFTDNQNGSAGGVAKSLSQDDDHTG